MFLWLRFMKNIRCYYDLRLHDVETPTDLGIQREIMMQKLKNLSMAWVLNLSSEFELSLKRNIEFLSQITNKTLQFVLNPLGYAHLFLMTSRSELSSRWPLKWHWALKICASLQKKASSLFYLPSSKFNTVVLDFSQVNWKNSESITIKLIVIF